MNRHTGRAALLVLASLAAVSGLRAGGTAPTNTGRADRVFLNGKIWTAEPGKPVVEALAVRGSTVLELGSSQEIRRLVGKGTPCNTRQPWIGGRT